MSDRPSTAKYTKSHEWVILDGEDATVGITDFAIEHLGDLVFVDLPEAGDSVAVGDGVAEIESVKAVGEIFSPVAGEVSAINEGLVDDQGPLTSDPFGTGWLYKVKAATLSDELMDLAAYEAQLDSDAG